MPMVSKKSPLHILLEMKDMQGCEYQVEGKEDGMIAIFPSSGGCLDGVSFNFENFAEFVWENKLDFVDDSGQPVPAFTSIEVVCEDLKDESVVRVFNLEKKKVFWYVPSTRTFINDDGVFKAEEMEPGNYLYEPFAVHEDSEILSKRAVFLRTELLGYDNADEFARIIGLNELIYRYYERGICQIPYVREMITNKLPWISSEWLAGRV